VPPARELNRVLENKKAMKQKDVGSTYGPGFAFAWGGTGHQTELNGYRKTRERGRISRGRKKTCPELKKTAERTDDLTEGRGGVLIHLGSPAFEND